MSQFLGEITFWGKRIFEEFLNNRTENLCTYSSKGTEGPRALHFPKFSENFPQFSNPKKLFSFLNSWSFKNFFLDSNKKNKSYFTENKKKLQMGFHLRNFPKFSEVRKFFFGNQKKNALGSS